ncbi:Surface antigen [Collimonas sp. OK242]|uniref:hypothetical protein n=1 Tax=Collimonas sp. OK242 TaxID=1798195 RepID=UPI00089799CE|nr:hypothetical protein [Collimonas sp. OK242]SDY43627.1 Surface antigen [Collimonas sp. OK242]
MYNEIPLIALVLALSACTGSQGTSGYAAKPVCQKVTTQAEINGQVQPVNGIACKQSDDTWQLMQNTEREYYGYPYAYYDPWYWGPFGFGSQIIFIDRDRHHHHFDHASMQHQSVAGSSVLRSGGMMHR